MMKGSRTEVDSRLVVVLAAAFVVALGLAVSVRTTKTLCNTTMPPK
jgi:hypothetical protein